MTVSPCLVLRTYRPDDHDRMVALNRYGLAAAGVPLDQDVYAGDLDDVEVTYPRGRGVLLVGEVDGEVVAMGGLRQVESGTCEILRVRVDPEHQGRGYGRAMLRALEDHAVRLGYSQVTLLTGPDQHPAIDLYRNTGYHEIAVEDHGGLCGVRLAKALAPLPG
ncbi:MAG: GNAT family N-acetyltransferase [Micromonosporaceae bacterium]|nr:GNAT family N-acetyltransferase [Micromonosporaceae bacterium]